MSDRLPAMCAEEKTMKLTPGQRRALVVLAAMPDETRSPVTVDHVDVEEATLAVDNARALVKDLLGKGSA